MKRIFLLTFVLVLLSLATPTSNLYAQGTYGCMIQVGIGSSTCIASGSENCQTGYEPGNSCSSLSLNPSSPNYCGSATAAPQCAVDPDYGGNGEPCRQNNLCDGNFICIGGSCISPGDPPPPPGGGNPTEFSGLCPDGGIDTAIGCIPFQDINELTKFFLRWALGIGGGIAILLIIYASFIIITSTGDPRRMQGGKELLTSAIAGVMLIIFSVFILRILGVNILGIF